MNSLALLCAVLAIELSGPAIDGGGAVALLVSEAGRVQSQWQLDSRDGGEYRFSSSDSGRFLITRLSEPDLSYAATQYDLESGELSMIGGVSFAPAAERIASLRRGGDGTLQSSDLLVSSAGTASIGDNNPSGVGSQRAGASPPTVESAESSMAGDGTGVDSEPMAEEGDIAIIRRGSALYIEYRPASILVSLTGLRTQSR